MCEIANRTKVVAIASQKGGSGKTSITISTAVHAQKAGFRIAIVDIDPQGSAALWENLRRRSGNQNPPHVTQCAARHLEGAIAELKRGGFAVVFVVTPGINSPDVDMALRVADLCVAPCEPAVFDLQATRVTFERARRLSPQAFFPYAALSRLEMEGPLRRQGLARRRADARLAATQGRRDHARERVRLFRAP